MIGYLSGGISGALLSPRTRADDPEALALVLESLRGLECRTFANAMRSISLGRPDLTPRLGAVRCPTLFVTGGDHEGWTPVQAEAKSRLLVDGEVAVVPDTAYLTPLEAPAESVRLIRAHWAQAAG